MNSRDGALVLNQIKKENEQTRRNKMFYSIKLKADDILRPFFLFYLVAFTLLRPNHSCRNYQLINP